MAKPTTDSRNYFTTYHFARDYLYSAASLLPASISAILLSGIHEELIEVADGQSFSGWAMAVLFFFVLSHGLGHVANTTLAVLMRFWARFILREVSFYAKSYRPYRDVLYRIHKRYFDDECFLLQLEHTGGIGVAASQLVGFFRQYEASGYVHVARLYAIAAFYRQLVVYFFAQCLVFLCFGMLCAVIVTLAVVICTLFNHQKLIREVVQGELAYVLATDARLRREDRDVSPAE